MELSRSSPYAVNSHYSATVRPAEAQAYIEQKILEQKLEEKHQIKSDLDNHVSARRRPPSLEQNAPQTSTVEVVIKRDETQQSHPVLSRDPLPYGQSSSPFLAQQIGQVTSEEDASLSESTASTLNSHAAGTQAYRDSRNLTISLLGFQGFKERTV